MKTDLLQPYAKHFLFTFLLFAISFNVMSQTKTRVAGAANWSANSTWIKPLPGLITTAFLSNGVLGLGTSFSSDLAIGDVICTSAGQQIGTVASISGITVTLTSFASVIITLGGYGVEKVPTAADDVEIGNTNYASVFVSLDVASATVNSLTFIADGQSNSLTNNSTNTLTVNNGLILQQPTSNSNTVAWNINAGTANVNGNINFSGVNSNTTRIAKIVITNGTLNANSDIIFSGSTAATKIIDMSGGAGSVNLKGALTVPSSSSTLTAGTSGSIFNYTGTAAQTINYFPSGKYYNLQINNTNVNGATLSAAIATSNVDGNLSLGNNNTGSLFNSGNYAIALNNSKTATIALGSTMNAGTSIISFGTGSPNLTINGTFKTANTNGFSGSTSTAVNSANPPTFVLGIASTIEYNSASNQTVTGRSDYANISVSGGATKTAIGIITANNNLNIGASTIFDAATYIHQMKGSLTSSGTFTASTSTMVFSGTGAQTIPGMTYNNLETSASGTKTAGGGFTVAGNFVIGSGTIFSASSYTHNIAGDFSNNGTFSAGTSTLNFNGVANQQSSGVSHFNSITLNNAHELILANSITVHGALTLTNGRLNINGKTLTLDGTFSGDATNSLKGSSSSNLIISNSFSSGNLYFDQTAATNNNYIRNFTLNSNATIGNDMNIVGASSVGTITLATGITLTTNDHLTLKSDHSGTARLAELPVDGTGAATAFINGKITIERYIPAARGWRLLSAPVKTTGAPTINEAWQEGLTTASANPNLYPGYGVKICGGSCANGFDTSATINSFIKTYNSSINTFTALPSSPGTNIAINSYPAYFLYIRGDRSVDMLQGLSAAITSTTLRTKGNPITGKQDVTVNGTGFTLLGNPYASAIDFHTLSKSNVGDMFYAWDPKLAGNYGIGGYVTFIWNNTTHTYDATGSVSYITQYIQSGAAVLIASADNTNPGTLSIKESDKTANGTDPIFRSNGLDQKLRVNLLLANTDSTSALLDGVLTTYDDDNLNAVDNNDAKKLFGSNQSITIKRDGKTLAIERRKTITANDTTFLNLYQMKIHNYKLEIEMQNMDNSGMLAILKDNYSSTTDNTILDMNGTTEVPFSVSADPGSYAVDRFKIVFETLAPVPLTFKTVSAIQQQKNIAVEWKTENEITTNHYEVEKSIDGSLFNKINTNPVEATYGGSGNYKFIDTNPVTGINYYRIASVSYASGQEIKTHSNIVKVNMQAVKDGAAISIYPNPATGNTINLKVNNLEAGIYNLQVYNMSGQLVSLMTIKYDVASSTGIIEINEKLPAGKYQLRLTGEHVSVQTQLIKK
ncbi:MAG: T9SS type A sorting domain-containing protein [Ferruginibacter sp.]